MPLVKTGLAVLGAILSDLGFPGAAACKLVIAAVDKYEDMHSNAEAMTSLKKHCGHIVGVIDDALKDRPASELSRQMTAALRRFGSQLDASVVPCEEEQRKHIFFKILNSSDYASRIQGIFDEVGRLIAGFVFEITLAGHFTLNEVLRSAENKALADNVQSLHPVGAAYNDNHPLNKKRTVCLAGTRTALLEEIGHWAVTRNKEPIYLLTGHAGFGKSTIARTVAERADALHILGASFFFSRDDADLKSSTRFFPTIAYQLCLFSETFAKAIGGALQSLEVSDAVKKAPATQLESLIIQPLIPLATTSQTILIVVDAFDECEEFGAWEEDNYRKDIWEGLATLAEELPFIRVLLTSRPHQQLSALVADNDRLYINNTVVEASDPDIGRYLTHHLVEKPCCSRISKWTASESEIRALEDMAAGLFIVAATAVRFVMDPRQARSPSLRIQDLIKGTTSNPASPNRLSNIDKMYETVLRLSLSLEHPSELQLFQTVVGTIIFLRRQFSVTGLARFLDVDADSLQGVIGKLQAIITLTRDTPQFHKSFVDYITDDVRSNELCIPQSRGNAVIAFRCLCTLSSAASSTSESIIYAKSRYCLAHFSAADPAIVKTLSTSVCCTHPSFWVEIATYLGPKCVLDPTRVAVTRCMDTGSEEAVAIFNLNLNSQEILPEETLRLMLTTCARARVKSYPQRDRMSLQYAKTLLYHLSYNDGTWLDHWITPPIYSTWLVKGGSRVQAVDCFCGRREDYWARSVSGMTYLTFEPMEEAWSILRQKLMESLPEMDNGDDQVAK